MRAILAGLVSVAIIVFGIVYFVFLPTSSPKPLKLAPSTTSAPTSSPTQLAGRWQVSGGSLAGYRVREQLAFLPAQSDAVGRTAAISGVATLARSGAAVSVSGASFSVAVNTLKSDRSMRDEKIHSIGLESDRYPTATFTLASPLTLPAAALAGHPAKLAASGIFNIHGTSKLETVQLEIVRSGPTLQAAGSLTFPWADFNMTAPSIGGFVTVTDKATMEFDLHLRRAA